MTITVSMPYHGTAGTVARAAASVLGQTHTDLRLIVVNDGGEDVWEPLEHIDDPRLIRFDLDVNRGRYWADAVTLGACGTEHWTVCDSDDILDLDHYERLLAAGPADAVMGGYTIHHGASTILRTPEPGRHRRDGRIRHTTHLGAVLWDTDALRSIGGPHPGWRIAYDTMLTALAAEHLDVAYTVHAGYHQHVRKGSLTQARETRAGSELRKEAWAARESIWQATVGLDRDALKKELTHTDPIGPDVERLKAML